ncbi:MAG TPA: hypothetical protein VH678_14990 [Xanthobacteraceae bacterium]|jgi:hypothetical protein
MLINCIAFYKPPVRLLAQTCLSSESIIGDNIVEGTHRLLPTKVSNTQSFGADKFTKTYAQSQVRDGSSCECAGRFLSGRVGAVDQAACTEASAHTRTCAQACSSTDQPTA